MLQVHIHIYMYRCIPYLTTVCSQIWLGTAVDGTFYHAVLKGKIQIKEQLPKYLGGRIQLGIH